MGHTVTSLDILPVITRTLRKDMRYLIKRVMLKAGIPTKIPMAK